MSFGRAFEPTSDGQHVKFLGFDQAGTAAPYMLKVRSKEVAEDLLRKLVEEKNALE